MTRQNYIFNKKVTAEWYQRAFVHWVRIGLTAALLIGALGNDYNSRNDRLVLKLWQILSYNLTRYHTMARFTNLSSLVKRSYFVTLTA